jgi:hypothetical protein
VFLGEARMYDKPVNLPVELDVSKAMDLGLEIDANAGSPEELREKALEERADVELRAFNAKNVPVTLEIRQQIESYRPDPILSNSSDLFRRKDGNFVWRLRVPANGMKVLTYSVEVPKPPDTEK